MHVVVSVCVHMYTYTCLQKTSLFSGLLPLKNFLLSVFYYFFTDFKGLQCCLLRPASCTDKAIHTCTFLLEQCVSQPGSLIMQQLPLPQAQQGFGFMRLQHDASNCNIVSLYLQFADRAHRVCVLWNSS